MIDAGFIVVGFILLILGGDVLIKGAVSTAQKLNLSPTIIGITFIGFGSSIPELVTSIEAAMAESPGIAIGNIVGSNIANIMLVLGVSALIAPIYLRDNQLIRDGALVVATAVLFTTIGFTSSMSVFIGCMLLASLMGYMIYAYRQETVPAKAPEGGEIAYATTGQGQAPDSCDDFGPTYDSLWFSIAVGVVGLVLVIIGGHLVVQGALGIASTYGVSETIIGLTIVAIGTSLPELVTSVIAVLRQQSSLAIGSILGSSIYNILAIGGVIAIVSPGNIPMDIVRFDNLIMVAASVFLFLLISKSKINRHSGAALFAGYCAYLLVLWQ